jgi:tetratricopeptide (TPR) repeat protein
MRLLLLSVINAVVPICIGCASNVPPVTERSIATDGQAASAHFETGDFGGALRLYRAALGAAEKADVPALQARYRFNLARIHFEVAAFDTARVLFSAAAAQFTSAGDSADAAVADIFGALTVAYTGDPGRAGTLLEAAAPAISKDDAVVLDMARSIVNMLAGDGERANAGFDRALEVYRARKDPLGRGTAFYYKAMIAAARQNFGTARQLLDSALVWQQRSPARYRNWRTLLGRAIVESCDGNGAGADVFYLRAEKAAPDLVVFPRRDMLDGCTAAWKR